MHAVVYISDFFLHSVLRAEPGLEKQSVVLIDAQEKKPIVLQLTAAARAARRLVDRSPRRETGGGFFLSKGGARDRLSDRSVAYVPTAIEYSMCRSHGLLPL